MTGRQGTPATPVRSPRRPARTEEVLSLHLSPWIVQALARLTATFAVVQGASIVWGGPRRWSSAAFTTALAVPGAPASWGIALALFGLAVLVGTFRHYVLVVATGMSLIGAWCLFFGISFAKTARENPTAGTTGIWTYAFICVAALILASAYLQSRDGGRRADEQPRLTPPA